VAQQRLSVGERVYRARRIGMTFGRIYLGIKGQQFVARRLKPPDMKERWADFNLESATAIFDAAIELRGLILKGCQFIGSRADVLPPEYIQVLSELQDRVPSKPFSSVRATVESEFGCPLEQVFESFGERAIASASLAQVHEARLHGGERVAVKVQYPEIESLVGSDLSNLRVLFKAVGVIERDFDLMPLINELGTQMPLELDFVNEAHNAERVAAFFADRDDVHVPRVHWEHTTRKVLVMEFIDGIKISDAPALRQAGVEPDAVMKTLIETYCEQILRQGFFHADPHPGNLLVQPTAGADGKPRLVLLDFGLAKELPADFRSGIVTLATALLGGDAGNMARALFELGFETREGGIEALHDIAEVVLDVAIRLRKQSYLDPAIAREAAEELPRMIRENPIVRVPSHVVLLGRVVALLSGLGRTLNAKVDMLTTILPYAMPAAPTTTPPADDGPAVSAEL
jgi:predicted unusual protein kinase regulating ubiquinone biosynthesis (AarF/ABC1/UbiB family)